MMNGKLFMFKSYRNPFDTSLNVIRLNIGFIIGLAISSFVMQIAQVNIINSSYFYLFWIILSYMFTIIIYQIYIFKERVIVIDNKVVFGTGIFSLKSCSVATDKYIVHDNNREHAKPVLYLEVWFDKNLLLIREDIKANTYQDLRVYAGTNLSHSLKTVVPGTIDKIEAFINEFNQKVAA